MMYASFYKKEWTWGKVNVVARAYVFVVISYIHMRNNGGCVSRRTGTEFTSLNKEPNGMEN